MDQSDYTNFFYFTLTITKFHNWYETFLADFCSCFFVTFTKGYRVCGSRKNVSNRLSHFFPPICKLTTCAFHASYFPVRLHTNENVTSETILKCYDELFYLIIRSCSFTKDSFICFLYGVPNIQPLVINCGGINMVVRWLRLLPV